MKERVAARIADIPEDWLTDLDLRDQGFVTDPYPVFDDLREQCRMAYSTQYEGFWVPTRKADIAEIAHNPAVFSSRGLSVIPRPLGGDESEDQPSELAAGLPPITSDPPDHTVFRRLLLPAFAPKPIAKWEPKIRTIANDLIDKFQDRGSCDAAVEYARHVPTTVIAIMLGVPPEDGDLFTDWIYKTLETGVENPEVAAATRIEMVTYLAEKIQEHRKKPQNDIMTHLIETEVDGKRLNDADMLGICFLLLIAGIDTTWSSIGAGLWYLSQELEDQERLRNEPDLMIPAVEEFLRVYSPVTLGRIATQDAEVAGCPIKKGDRVLMAFPAGNRDPDAFEDSDKIDIDRQVNRHYAFGVGIHRCLGSNLARLEMKVALEEFLRRIPTFRLTDPDVVRWSAGAVRGPRRIPIEFAVPS